MRILDDTVGCFGSCWLNLRSLIPVRPVDHVDHARDDFERIVTFLASVPIFKHQLPRSELPKVAQNLVQQVWHPGQHLVKQGETGRALFVIQSGEALVSTCPGPGLPEEERAVLCQGDYFGGHTLITERPNVATITANGPVQLVTLSMSREAFTASGLKQQLLFPKRRAIYGDDWTGSKSRSVPENLSKLGQNSAADVAFIQNAISRNVNLRALFQVSTDTMNTIAKAAEKRRVPEGTVVARSGEPCGELFIISRGSFDVSFQETSDMPQSAEAAVAHSTMAERLLRKQHFLRALAGACVAGRAERFARKTISLMAPGPGSPGTHQHEGLGEEKALRKGIEISHLALSLSSKSRAYTLSDATALTSNDMSTVPSATSLQSLEAPLSPSSECSSSPASLPSPPQETRSPFVVMNRRARQPKQGNRANQPARNITVHEVAADENLPTSSADPEPTATIFRVGESFGELSLLYNTRSEATFRAREDSEVFVLNRRNFKDLVSRRPKQFKEHCQLLEEVTALSALLSSERWELACHSTGLVYFKPHERVLHQGKVREAKKWYVIVSGTCVMSCIETDGQSSSSTILGRLQRADFFGERNLLRGVDSSDISCDAGPEGMSCLTFDLEAIKPLLEGVFQAYGVSASMGRSEWCELKSRGFLRNALMPSRNRSVNELHTLSQLKKVCLLGRGSFGEVTLVQSSISGGCYALKKLCKAHIVSQGAGRHVAWERELLTMVDSRFVVRLEKTFRDKNHVYFMFEAMIGGSLLDVMMNQPHVITEDMPRGINAAFYIACTVSALEHLHERRIVHRDVKPENVLLDLQGYAKVCDMGFARFVLGKTNTLAGTPDYMAPEMIDVPHTHGISVDWWSLGVLTYELLAGQPPFEDEGISDPMGRLLAIRRSQELGRLNFPFHFPSVARGFVQSLLQKLPCRLGASKGAADVRNHVMFQHLKFDFQALAAGRLAPPFLPSWTEPREAAADDGEVEDFPTSISGPSPSAAPSVAAWDRDF